MRRTDDFAISHKLRLQDSLQLEEGYIKVGTLFRKKPIFLWDIVHQRGRRVSLNRDVYNELKLVVGKLSPERVQQVEAFNREYLTRSKFKRGEGNFRSLGKRPSEDAK